MASGNVNRTKRANFQNGPALRQLESVGPLLDCGDLNGRLGNFKSKLKSSPWNRHPDRTKRALTLEAVKVRPGRASSAPSLLYTKMQTRRRLLNLSQQSTGPRGHCGASPSSADRGYRSNAGGLPNPGFSPIAHYLLRYVLGVRARDLTRIHGRRTHQPQTGGNFRGRRGRLFTSDGGR
jgi:hypothetical protein